MNVDTGELYRRQDGQMLALMRGEHIVPVEHAQDQAQRLNTTGMNRHERRKAAKLAKTQRRAPADSASETAARGTTEEL